MPDAEHLETFDNVIPGDLSGKGAAQVQDLLPNISETRQSRGTQGRRHICKPDPTSWWKSIVEIGAFLLGIYFAFIYWGQLRAMRGQLKQTEDSARYSTQVDVSSKMPVVFPGALTLSKAVSKDGRRVIRVRLPVINSGESEAVRPQFQWGYGHQPPVSDTDFPWSNTTWRESIWPKGTPGVDFEDIPISDLKPPVYVYGVIQYLDVFPLDDATHCRKDHRVQWSIRFDTISIDRGRPRWDGVPIERGSCFDEWCRDAYTENTYQPQGSPTTNKCVK